MIDLETFATLLDDAMRRYDVRSLGFDAKDLLPTAVILTDLIVGELPEHRRVPRPTLHVVHMDLDKHRRFVAKELKHVDSGSEYGECMVDVYVSQGERDPFRTILTIESEGGAAENSGTVTPDATSDTCDYLWDLFKLLHVSSPLRIFLAIANNDKVKCLEGLVDRHAEMYGSVRRPSDVVFTVVFPASELRDTAINIRRWHEGTMASFVLRDR